MSTAAAYAVLLLLDGVYTGIAGYATRREYIRQYRAFLEWKEQGPYEVRTVHDAYGYSTSHTGKAPLVWEFWREHVSGLPSPGIHGLLWPLPVVTWAYRSTWGRFIHPEVKAPDYKRISELEEK